jgi:hypothetical protein
MKPKTLFLILFSLFLTFSCVIKTKVKIGNNTETYHQIDKVVHHKYDENGMLNQETLTIDTKLKHFNDKMIMNIKILGWKERDKSEPEYYFFRSDSFLLFNLYGDDIKSIMNKWENSDGSVDEIFLEEMEPLSKELYNEIDYWIINWRD